MDIDNYQDTIVFDVQLEKPPGTRLGIDVSMVPAGTGGSLVVESISSAGAVQMWNSSHKSPFVIQQGDSIIRVNGVDESDVASMAAALSEQGTLRVTFRRGSAKVKALDTPDIPDNNMGKGNWNRVPEMVMGSHGEGSYIMGLNGKRLFKYEAFMAKPKGIKFGFHVMPSSEPRGLSVKAVAKHGLVDLWNQTKPEIYRVRPGDCISEVNGFTCRRMIDELQSASELRLLVLRPEVKNTPANGQVPQEQLALPPRNNFDSPLGLGDGGSMGPTGGAVGGPCGFVGGVGGVGGSCDGRGGAGGGGGCCTGAGAHSGWNAGPPTNMLEMGAMPQQVGNLSGGFNNVNEEPLIFYVEIERPPGARFGIQVLPAANGLIVERVSPDGCVAIWNARSRPPAQVQEGDLITVVNGVKGEQHVSYMAMQLGNPAAGTTTFVVRRDNPSRGGGACARGAKRSSPEGAAGADWSSGTTQYANSSSWNNFGPGQNRQTSGGLQHPADNYGDLPVGGRSGGFDIPAAPPCGYSFPQQRGGVVNGWSPDHMSAVSQPKAAWPQHGQHLGMHQHPPQGQNDYNMMMGGGMSGHANAPPPPPPFPGSLPSPGFFNNRFGDYCGSAQGREPFIQEDAGDGFGIDGLGGQLGPTGRPEEYFQGQLSSKEIAARARRFLSTRGFPSHRGDDVGDAEIFFSRLDMLSDESKGMLLHNALKSRPPSLVKVISDALELLPPAPVETF